MSHVPQSALQNGAAETNGAVAEATSIFYTVRVPRTCSPAVAVGSVNIDAKLNQKLDNLSVAGTDGVVQRCDALVIRHAGVLHLQDTHVNILIIKNNSGVCKYKSF